MLENTSCQVAISEVATLPEGLKSAIGHADTAAVLGVEMNRVNVSLAIGDTAYVAQLQGGRLPEGSTTLPEGFAFKYLKVEITSHDAIIRKYLSTIGSDPDAIWHEQARCGVNHEANR